MERLERFVPHPFLGGIHLVWYMLRRLHVSLSSMTRTVGGMTSTYKHAYVLSFRRGPYLSLILLCSHLKIAVQSVEFAQGCDLCDRF